jgi:hypothetical protein
MWILFFILITSPGQFTVTVLETYQTPTAERECKDTSLKIKIDYDLSYPSSSDKDTYSFVCLKQKEKEV